MIILDNIDDYIRVAKLETLPSMKSEMIGQFNLFWFRKKKIFVLVPTYVKTIIDILTDSNIDDEAFEAVITQHKIKYLK